MEAFKRKNLLGMAAGIALAGVPLLAFNLWLNGLVDRQGRDDIAQSARRAVMLAEARVAQTMTGLDQLAAQGVNSCSSAHVEALRRAVLVTVPIKGSALLGPENQILCSNSGLTLGLRSIVTSEAIEGTAFTLEALELEGGRRLVRLKRGAPESRNSLAAVIPLELFLPQIATNGGPISTWASMVTRGGASIGDNGAPVADQSKDMFVGSAQSQKFGFVATTSMPRARVLENHSDISWLSLFATAMIGLAIAGFALLLPRRQVGNPVADLERALEAGEFIPYYQPIVDIRSGQLRGAEVLMRWKKPDGTLVYPGNFIPLAESSGLIFDMTKDLMKRVCAEAGASIGKRPGMKIAFNFAAQLFRDDSIVKDVRNIFAGTPIDLSQVVLELTERDPIENLTDTRRVVAALQGLGVRIAIDDVGTGHSGLSYMLKLGVDIIKIDKMFVDSIGTDRNSTTIVETLVDLAHNMRMDIVAEGVENFEQVTHLRELGIRSAQGYVFAPPLPGNAFLQLMESLDPLPAAAMEGKVAGAARRYISARNKFDAA